MPQNFRNPNFQKTSFVFTQIADGHFYSTKSITNYTEWKRQTDHLISEGIFGLNALINLKTADTNNFMAAKNKLALIQQSFKGPYDQINGSVVCNAGCGDGGSYVFIGTSKAYSSGWCTSSSRAKALEFMNQAVQAKTCIPGRILFSEIK